MLWKTTCAGERQSSHAYSVIHITPSNIKSSIGFVCKAHVHALNIKCLSTSIELGFTDGFTRERKASSQWAPDKRQRKAASEQWVNNIECLHLYTSLFFIRQAHLVCLESLESPKGPRHIIWGKQIHRAHVKDSVSAALSWRQQRGNCINKSVAAAWGN